MNTEEYTPKAGKIYFIGFFCILLAVLSIFLAHTLFATPSSITPISNSQIR